jgi:hypothetical protein
VQRFDHLQSGLNVHAGHDGDLHSQYSEKQSRPVYIFCDAHAEQLLCLYIFNQTEKPLQVKRIFAEVAVSFVKRSEERREFFRTSHTHMQTQTNTIQTCTEKVVNVSIPELHDRRA